MAGTAAHRQLRTVCFLKMIYLKDTKSLCPVCLRPLHARIVERDGWVYMEKNCPDHGDYSVKIWGDRGENYLRWLQYGGTEDETVTNCPHGCGLCSEHGSQSVSAALMVTTQCDLNCPVCFTRGGQALTPSIEALRHRLAHVDPSVLLELCGGEPTTRDDLPEIVAMASAMGFDYIQLNTNGIRIGREPWFLQKLKDCGLTTVYMGLDGVVSRAYEAKSGLDIFEAKIAALESCRAAGVAVVLVPCVIPGVNDDQLGKIVDFAKQWMPTVKGIYFQPISYFGAYPQAPTNEMRITIPEIIRKLEEQTKGEVPMSAFLPGRYEHGACSFNGFFGKRGDRLCAYTSFGPRERADDAAELRRNSKTMWKAGPMEFLSIGGMAFQDVWNIDLQRVCRCTIHVIGEEGKKYPLCSKYLTSCSGERLYPNIS